MFVKQIIVGWSFGETNKQIPGVKYSFCLPPPAPASGKLRKPQQIGFSLVTNEIKEVNHLNNITWREIYSELQLSEQISKFGGKSSNDDT